MMLNPLRLFGGAGAPAPRARPAARPYRPDIQALEARALLSGASIEPTAYEQYMLELINRARANPIVEGQRLTTLARTDQVVGVATQGENLSLFLQTISSYGPEAPLAFDPNLIQAARAQSQAMLAGNSQFHSGGPYAENVFAYSTVVNANDPTVAVDYFNAGFFLDWGNPSFGHLSNLLAPGAGTVGVGLLTNVTPTTPAAPGMSYNVGPDIVTQEFSPDPSTPYLTGTVYRDTDGNQFYTPGEGLGSVLIQAVGRNGQGTFQTQTWASGGYSLALPAGTYDVTASGNGAATQATTVTIGSHNVGWSVRYANDGRATALLTDTGAAQTSPSWAGPTVPDQGQGAAAPAGVLHRLQVATSHGHSRARSQAPRHAAHVSSRGHSHRHGG